MKPIPIILVAFLFTSSTVLAAEPFHSNSRVLATTYGDLNKDGKPEKVSVFDTGKETDLGSEREIRIYKKNNGKWDIWHVSIGAVLPSQHGGGMGDPFESIDVENGTIVINHFGGSSHKWHYTHRYRWQNNNWYLIGATIFYGRPCDSFFDFDFNLSTGHAIYKKSVEKCEKDIFQEHTQKLHLPNINHKMDGFYPGNNLLKHSKLDREIYY